MIYKVKLRLTTNFLGGGKRQRNSVRALERTHDGQIAINENEWRKHIDLASKQLELGLDTSKLVFESGFDAGSKVSIIRRVYNKVNTDLFEGIRKGNNLEIQFVYKDEPKVSPSIEEISKLLEIVGKFYGMSQWGLKFHCGRFLVKNVERVVANEQGM